MIMRYIYYLLCFILVLSACSKDGDETANITSTTYMPMTFGKYVDYKVQETIFRNEGVNKDSSSYFLREEMVGTFNNEIGETIYQIDRSTRSTIAQNWQYLNTWQVHIAENQVIRVEENIPYVKLVLPVDKGQKWNGNALFDPSNGLNIGGTQIDYFKEWESEVIDENTSITMNELTFTDVIEVSLADFENRLEIRKANELYAAGIGLIRREIQILDTQCFTTCENIPWIEKGEIGLIFIQEIIDYN